MGLFDMIKNKVNEISEDTKKVKAKYEAMSTDRLKIEAGKHLSIVETTMLSMELRKRTKDMDIHELKSGFSNSYYPSIVKNACASELQRRGYLKNENGTYRKTSLW